MKLIKLLLIVFMPMQIAALQLQELQPFDWNGIVDVPAPTNSATGAQVLHFRASVKNYKADPTAVAFVAANMNNAVPLTSDADVLRFGVDAVTINGTMLSLVFVRGDRLTLLQH